MTIKRSDTLPEPVAVIRSDTPVITDTRSALDLLMQARHETGCDRIAIHKAAITEDFFVLRTGIAGEILQKCINYHFKFAVFGDFSGYTSNALKDFIYESNRGKDIFFLPTEAAALEKLSEAPL